MAPARAKRPARTYRLEVRLTDDERTMLERNAQLYGVTVSDLVRTRILGGRLRSRPNGDAAYQAMQPALFAQLSRIGNNLNQLTRAFNATGQAPEASRVIGAVREVWEVMLADEVTARHALSAEAKVRPR